MKDPTINDIISMPLEELFGHANKVRTEWCGGSVELCGIINAKSGRCAENCSFCAQSARYNASVNEYSLKTSDEIVRASRKALKNGASHFGIVTSGNALTEEELGTVAEAIRRIVVEVGIVPCASLGALSIEAFSFLKSAGLKRYHHNIETSRRYYPSIVTTHGFSQRVETIRAAQKAGLEVCSGGILGLGETWEDRYDMAVFLKELEVDSVPVNFLIPMNGTPLGRVKPMKRADAIRAIALFRIILKQKPIKVIAGRESIFKDEQEMIFKAGANGMMVGGYLTVSGRQVELDRQLVSRIKGSWSRG
ncbi:MAG: biotin synthase BioB [Candidatus Omnitrophica bacterium]|nr:biotin synthase BioB [Candidatus Omnitrophota bacterium]